MKVKLGDITKIRTGKLDANAASEDGFYPFYTCSREPLKISTYSYECECVLVAGNGDLNVKYYNGKFDAYQRTYIIEAKKPDILYMPYLYYFMEKYVVELRKLAIGGVIKYIKLGNLTDALIELPTYEQQHILVERLEKVKSAIDKRNAQLAKLDELVKCRFVEMFGDIELNYKLEDLCSLITDGTHQPPQFTDSGIPFLLVSNIKENYINYETYKFIDEQTYRHLIKRTPVETGDLLLSTVGSYGHPAIVQGTQRFCFQRHIAFLKPIRERVNSVYLHQAILSDNVQEQIEKSVLGVAQKTLNLSAIRRLVIPYPPIEKQNSFASFVRRIDKLRFVIQKSLDETQKLFDSLMQEYFD